MSCLKLSVSSVETNVVHAGDVTLPLTLMVYVLLVKKKKNRMLYPRLTDCSSCINLLDILCQIDERIAYYADNQYHKMTLMIGGSSDTETIGDLIRYKGIITNRLHNPSYAESIPLANIISRIKILLYK